MTLVEKVKNLCEQRGTTIFALENACGLSNGSIVKWDTCVPNVRGIKAVAEYFDTTIDDVLTDVVIPPKKTASISENSNEG